MCTYGRSNHMTCHLDRLGPPTQLKSGPACLLVRLEFHTWRQFRHHLDTTLACLKRLFADIYGEIAIWAARA